MKQILILLITIGCLSCNSKQREQENALLFPERNKYGFNVSYNIQYFPDVNIYFNFSCHPSKKTLIAIEEEFKKFESQYQKVFIHKMKRTKDEDQYLISVNFNTIDFDTYSEFDMKRDVGELDTLLQRIDANSDIQDLLAVNFE